MRAILEWLGRQARWALPAGVFVGIAIPPLAGALRPTLTAAVIGTLTAALVRLDWQRLAGTLSSPRLPALLVIGLLAVSPVLGWLVWWLGLASDPVGRILVLQLAAPPIGSAAAFALFVGIDGSLAMIVTVAATLLLPLTLTAVVAVLLPGSGIAVDLATFFLRVLLVVVAPFAIAAALRALCGTARLARNDGLLAGINVLLLVAFAIAVMDGVTAQLFADPAGILGLLALACAVALLAHLAGFVLFRGRGRETALAAALLWGNRNLGLMLAVTGGTAGTLFGLYVGVAQIPMYFAPLLLAPLAPIATRSRQAAPVDPDRR
jgi:predicted Na+-dependent transporter